MSTVRSRNRNPFIREIDRYRSIEPCFSTTDQLFGKFFNAMTSVCESKWRSCKKNGRDLSILGIWNYHSVITQMEYLPPAGKHCHCMEMTLRVFDTRRTCSSQTYGSSYNCPSPLFMTRTYFITSLVLKQFQGVWLLLNTQMGVHINEISMTWFDVNCRRLKYAYRCITKIVKRATELPLSRLTHYMCNGG